MPPPLFPSTHRGMTANPLKPVKRYRPGKAIAEEPSEEEENEEEDETQVNERERRRRLEVQRRQQQQKQPAPKATSFPSGVTGNIARDVKSVKVEDADEEGFITEEDEAEITRVTKPLRTATTTGTNSSEDDEESEEEEETSEEESADETPRRVLLRPTFIKKDKRADIRDNTTSGLKSTIAAPSTDSAAEAEARRAQRQEKANMLVKEQLEKDAIARTAGSKAWDDEEAGDEEKAVDDRDGLDTEAEYAAWKLRELKRIKRERGAIEAAEKERDEIERRRNLTAEERDREDREFLARQQEERGANRGQAGFMQRYFHKGAFFRDDLEREGLDKRNIMGGRFVDDITRETLPQYMQVRDMTKLGRKGRTKYKDLRSEDTGRWGEGFDIRPKKLRDETLINITDERFLPDRRDDRGKGPTGANAHAIRERQLPQPQPQPLPRSRSRTYSESRRRSRSRSFSPRRRRYTSRDEYEGDDREYHHRGRDSYRNADKVYHSKDRYRDDPKGRRRRSLSPHGDRDKRRRLESVSTR